MEVVAVTKNNFNKEVLQSEKPVLLDFYATWCMPCKMLSPVIEEISKENEEVKVCKVNVDQEPELAAQFEIMSIPTLVTMKNGDIVGKTIGLRPKKDILQMLAI